MWDQVIIDKRICHVLNCGQAGPVFIWPFYYDAEDLEHIEELLSEENFESGYSVIACDIRDWDRELSPWPGPAMDGSIMGGEGKGLLEWIEASLYPWIFRRSFTMNGCCLMGYSLAGLFALWSMYGSDRFNGCICASGSLWFEGWDEYAQTHRLLKNCSIYLSLGGKEEKTKKLLMATVGERTRQQEKLLKADPLCEQVKLEMNPGGHFADSVKRLVKGIRWIMETGMPM